MEPRMRLVMNFNGRKSRDDLTPEEKNEYILIARETYRELRAQGMDNGEAHDLAWKTAKHKMGIE